MLNILFVCTHNRCRSILCEAIFNAGGGDSLQAASAGSQPEGLVHPLSLRYLAEAGIRTEGLRSQSWDDLGGFAPDLVVTVCDNAAGESCPLWLGSTPKVHWGLSDPSKVEGDAQAVEAAFKATMSEIQQRLNAVLELPLSRLDADQVADELRRLGAV